MSKPLLIFDTSYFLEPTLLCIMHRYFAYILILVSTCTCFAQGFKPYRGVVSDAYDFWFYNPEAVMAEESHYPLLIFLHGRSLCGRDLNRVKRYGAVDAVTRGRIIDSYILAPQNPGGAWNPKRIMNIVEWAVRNFHVDTTRVYVYGMSLGGFGTLDFCAAYPDKVAAGMALCGGSTAKDMGCLSRVPLWIVHGTADRAVPVRESDRVVEAIRATGDDSRLIYTRMPGIDHGRPARIFYLLQTYDWLFSHSTHDPGREVNRSFEITPEILNGAYRDFGHGTEIDTDDYE